MSDVDCADHWARIAVDVDPPYQDECRGETGAHAEHQRAPLGRGQIEDAAEAIAGRHHADPGNQRVGHDHRRAGAKRDLSESFVQDLPHPSERCHVRRADAVERVMPGNHRHAEQEQRRSRQIYEHGQCDHRPSDRPDDLPDDDAVRQVEGGAKQHERHLDDDEPQSARHEEPRDGAAAHAAPRRQVRAGARKEHEHRRTEMRGPSREK